MGKFITSAILEYMPEEDLWQTSDELKYEVAKDDIITVPDGFITDLASVPWPVSMFIPKSGRYNPPAIVHDFLYFMSRVEYLLASGEYTVDELKERIPLLNHVDPEKFQYRSRKEADEIFLTAMKDIGVNLFKRLTMYRAVRTFAWLAWGKRGRIIGYDSKKGIMRLV